MNSVYCSSCGGKVEYLLKPPSFCSHCGTSMLGGKAAANRPSVQPMQNTQPQKLSAASMDDDPDGTDVSYVPNIGKLQYEVDGDYGGIGRSHGSLGSLFSAAAAQGDSVDLPETPSSSSPTKAKDLPQPSPEQKIKAVQQSIKDCQSSADNPSDVG